MKTTSKYEENGFADIISGLVKVYDPKVVVELGTQQGASAIIIGKALKNGHLYTYDLFEDTYNQPPYAKTHASMEAAKHYIYSAGIESKVTVRRGDAFYVHQEFLEVDMLHIDVCNHYDNLSVILPNWRYKVNNAIIIEGGVYNHWQKSCGFRPFNDLLKRHFIADNYSAIIFNKDNDYALTVLVRKYD